MLMKNTKDHELRVPAELVDAALPGEAYVTIAPGAEVECKEGYCRPMRAANGSRIPSIAERLAPGLVPADDAERESWAGVPEKNWEAPIEKKSPEQLRLMGLSPGKAEYVRESKKEPEPKVVEVPTEDPDALVEKVAETLTEDESSEPKKRRGRPLKQKG